jgi:hypothetical protein
VRSPATQYVELQGSLSTVTLRPRAGPALGQAARESGVITVIWLGRRHRGIEPGRRVQVGGSAHDSAR